MEHFFGQVSVGVLDYWWLIILAYFVVGLVKAKVGVEAAINDFKPETVVGGASWADNADLKKAGLFGGKGIPIGYSPDGRHALHYPGSGHIFVDAGARSGKGATLLGNIQLSWDGSLFAVDPKGELSATCGHHRKKFGNVFLLKPLAIPQAEGALRGLKVARYNPLCILNPELDSFHILCDKLANAVVTKEERAGKYFSDTARIIISGTIAALARHGDPDNRNLVEVARVIGSGEGFFKFCRNAVTSSDPFIVQKLARFALDDPKKATNEINDVIATATSNLSFVANAAMAYSLGASDVRFADLRRKPGTTIYVSLPLSVLDVTDKYYRLITECFLAELLDEGGRRRAKPTLAIIDEMASVGEHLKSLENAQGMISGAAGLIILGVVQSVVQLQGMFPKTWQVFVQNAGVFMAFACRSETDTELVSKRAGTSEVITRSRTASIDRMTGAVVIGESGGQHSRPLIYPHDVAALGKDEMIMFVEGVNGPVRARRKPYWKVCRGFRKNPYIKNSK